MLGACDGDAQDDSATSPLAFEVESARFLGGVWGQGLAGSGDLLLTNSAWTCQEVSDAASEGTYWEGLTAGTGVFLRLWFLVDRADPVDPWRGLYSPESYVPGETDDGGERLEPGRRVEALFFQDGQLFQDSSGLLVEVVAAGLAGVGGSWDHVWGGGDFAASHCGSLPASLATLSGPAACRAWVEDYNTCWEAHTGEPDGIDPDSAGCDYVGDRFAGEYLCLAEAYGDADCGTGTGWEEAVDAAGRCSG